jgi:hypothetical protein
VGPIQAITSRLGWGHFRRSDPVVGRSMIVTSNKPFGRWGEVFGDATVAAAMIDRLVPEVLSLKGDSYRLTDKDLGRVPNDDAA